MTTIAFDGKTISWDSRLTSDEKIISDNFKDKVRTYEDKNIAIASTGSPQLFDIFYGIYKNKNNLSKVVEVFKEVEDIVYEYILFDSKNKKVFVFTEGNPLPIEIPWEPCAFGTGAKFAKGALDHGASSFESVKIAIENDMFSGGVVNTSFIGG